MHRPWASDLAATGLLLVLVDALVPVTDHVARVALEGAWPWLVAVAGFVVLRLLVWLLFAGMGLLVRTFLPEEPARAG